VGDLQTSNEAAYARFGLQRQKKHKLPHVEFGDPEFIIEEKISKQRASSILGFLIIKYTLLLSEP
jgi:hypothetical protein